MKKQTSTTYSQVGDNYDTKDPIKKLAQNAPIQKMKICYNVFVIIEPMPTVEQAHMMIEQTTKQVN